MHPYSLNFKARNRFFLIIIIILSVVENWPMHIEYEKQARFGIGNYLIGEVV